RNQPPAANSSAPTPRADSTNQITLADTIPSAARRPCRAPSRMACDTTNNTAGPGEIESTVSVSKNSHQVCQLTVYAISQYLRTHSADSDAVWYACQPAGARAGSRIVKPGSSTGNCAV